MKNSFNKSEIFKFAHSLVKKGIKSFSEALKMAWARAKSLAAKTVTFVKKSGEQTTRRVAPLNVIGYKAKSDKEQSVAQASTIKMVDLDKLDAGQPPYRCIISFHRNQIVKINY